LSENWDKIRGQIDELGVASELVYPAFATEYRGGEGERAAGVIPSEIFLPK